MTTSTRQDRFQHIGLLYHDAGEYTGSCASFVRRGLESGDPVMVAVPAPHVRLLREELGGDATLVRFADMTVAGRNPGRILPWVLLDFAGRHPGRRVWIVGEPVWPGRTAMEYPACAVHEALINTAFADSDAAILCPYDAVNLDPEAIADSQRTHPVLADGSNTWKSPDYTEPLGVAAMFNQPLPEPPPHADRQVYAGAGDLARLRACVEERARAAGLSHTRIADLLIAVNELASNTVDHTAAGHGTLSVWTEPGVLVCQIDDYGRLTDPAAGHLPPLDPLGPGHGLTLVQQLTDLLRTYSRPDGTTFRLHMHLHNDQEGARSV